MTHGSVNNFLCGVVVVFFTISVTECQLEFRVQQSFHGVNLQCSVGDLRSTNFFHLDSLLIFRLVAGNPEIIASLSSHYGHDPVSHLQDAQVTGHLSNEDTFGSYLRIIWDHSQDDPDGDYICQLNGVDEDFIPLSLTEELSFQVNTICPCFGATPEVLRVGLTEELEAICYIPNPPAVNISRLASLEIIITINGMKQILAEINSVTGIAVRDGPSVSFVNGSLSGRISFLRVVLEYPTAGMASEYICEGSGVGVSGDPVFFSRSVQVSLEVPDSEEFIQRLFEMYEVQKELKRCQEERDRVTNTSGLTSSSTTVTTPVITSSTSIITRPVIISPTSTITTPVITSPTTTATTPVITSPTTTATTPVIISPTTTTTTRVITSSTTTATTPVIISPITTATTPVITSPTTTVSLTTKKSIYPRSCEDANLPLGQNVVIIQPDDGLGTIMVLCEVIPPQETWTIFQKRFDGSVSFYRNFSEYRNGFGNVFGEFWLGLDNTRRILLQNNDNNRLKVDLIERSTKTPYTRTYPMFSIGSGDGYTLNISGGVIDGGNGISPCVGQAFSTYDHGYSAVADASNRAAGWWFPPNGGYVNINGMWDPSTPAQGMYWYEFTMSWASYMGHTEMKFRRNN